MKYKIGQGFTYMNGYNETISVIGYKYEINKQIKSSSKYLTELEIEAYIDKGILIPSKITDKDYEIKALELKYNIKLKEVE